MGGNLPITIVKIGTNLLTTSEGILDLDALHGYASAIATRFLQHRNHIIMVTSGSITCGSYPLGIKPVTIPERQAAASVGQILLMKEYSTIFSQFGISVGQLLLTKDGIEDELRKHHAKNTIMTLLDHGVIPIINENDTVATDEIDQKFGDNDQLSALVAQFVGATQLILLTDTDGVYTKNPKLHSDAVLIKRIDRVTDDILAMVEDVQTGRSRGGMTSKLSAAKLASERGVDVYIANGRTDGVLSGLLKGESYGTHIIKQIGG